MISNLDKGISEKNYKPKFEQGLLLNYIQNKIKIKTFVNPKL